MKRVNQKLLSGISLKHAYVWRFPQLCVGLVAFTFAFSGCRPTLYNSDPSSIQESATTTSDSTTVASAEVATDVTSSPSPAASDASTSSAATVLTVSGPSGQTKGTCGSFSLTSSNSAGTATALSAAAIVGLTGGTTSVFSTNEDCSSAVTSLTLSKLESSMIFYHRSVDSDTISITPSLTGFTGIPASLSMSSGSWSTPDFYSSSMTGMPAAGFFDHEFWTYFTDSTSLYSAHRSLTGTWSTATTVQSGLDTPGVPLVRSDSTSQMILYHALGGDGSPDVFARTYSSASGYSSPQQLDATSVNPAKTRMHESNSSGDYITTWVEGNSGFASLYKKTVGTFGAAETVVNTGVAPSMVKSVLYDDGTGILFANVSSDLNYATLSASGWSVLTSLGVNGIAVSLAKTTGLSSTIVYAVAGVLYETSHSAGSATIGTSAAITGAGTGSNTSLGIDSDGNLFLTYLNLGATEMAVMNRTAGGVWTTPTAILAPGGGAITISSGLADNQGNAIAFTDQGGHLFVSRYVKGVGWSTIAQVDNLTNTIQYPTIAFDLQGHAMMTWKQMDDQSVDHFYYSFFQ